MRRAGIAFISGLCGLIVSCKIPSINLATDEPIKVDINMRLDVYQYDATGVRKTSDAAVPTTPVTPGADPETRRKNRAADVQVFKNSRLVGEGRDGLLVVLEETPGEYGEFIVRTARAENADRIQLMKDQAENEKRPLPEVQTQQAEWWRNRSFSGEWIEAPQPDGTFKWMQKSG
jgi:hypothetical protein